jgi:hypothetical protein
MKILYEMAQNLSKKLSIMGCISPMIGVYKQSALVGGLSQAPETIMDPTNGDDFRPKRGKSNRLLLESSSCEHCGAKRVCLSVRRRKGTCAYRGGTRPNNETPDELLRYSEF